MTTAEKIKRLRTAKGMTMEELGKKVGVQRSAINKYEKGIVVNIKSSTLRKLADALGVTPAELLDDRDDGGQPETITAELIAKIHRLSTYNQYMLSHTIDAFLQAQEEMDRKGGAKDD